MIFQTLLIIGYEVVVSNEIAEALIWFWCKCINNIMIFICVGFQYACDGAYWLPMTN